MNSLESDTAPSLLALAVLVFGAAFPFTSMVSVPPSTQEVVGAGAFVLGLVAVTGLHFLMFGSWLHWSAWAGCLVLQRWPGKSCEILEKAKGRNHAFRPFSKDLAA